MSFQAGSLVWSLQKGRSAKRYGSLCLKIAFDMFDSLLDFNSTFAFPRYYPARFLLVFKRRKMCASACSRRQVFTFPSPCTLQPEVAAVASLSLKFVAHGKPSISDRPLWVKKKLVVVATHETVMRHSAFAIHCKSVFPADAQLFLARCGHYLHVLSQNKRNRKRIEFHCRDLAVAVTSRQSHGYLVWHW